MSLRRLPFLLLPTLLVWTPAPARDVAADSEARLRRDVIFLASDECEGRGPTTHGLDLAARYIAGEFERIGLKPGPSGSYFQPFAVPGAAGSLTLTGPLGQVIALKQGVHFYPLGYEKQGKVSGRVAFAGYGITSTRIKYDDYAGLDVAGKVVVLLRDAPRSSDRDFKDLRPGAPLAAKLANAAKHRAAGVLLINDFETARAGDGLLDFSYSNLARWGRDRPLAALVRRDVVQAMLPAGADLADLERAIDRDLKPHGLHLPGWTVTLQVKTDRERVRLKNVVGVLEGAGPLAKETVILGAHYDHLGYGGPSSLATTKRPAVHHGADDNASGATALMELARRFARDPGRRGRRLVFLAFSGEEIALLGSRHYCAHPLFPLDATVAMVNLDMVGRLREDPRAGKDRLLAQGTGTAKEFKPLLDRLVKKYDFQLVGSPGGFGPSDHSSFCAKKVPVLFFWTGDHPDYHRPSDTADKINVAGMRKVTDFTEEVVAGLSALSKRPAFVEVKGGGGMRPSSGPRLGIRPEYGGVDDGVAVEGVTPGLPAERAGIKEGDRIVAIAGKPVKDLRAYMTVLAAQKKGDTIEVVVLRAGKRVPLRVKLE
jgi:hypothetical protein